MVDQLEIAARNLRQALIQFRGAEYNEDNGVFYAFPAGCCDIASAYLGRYLIQEGVVSENKIDTPEPNSYNSRSQCHAWLRICGTIHVDITADQFDQESRPIIIAAVSPFHEDFEVAGWRSFDQLDSFIFGRFADNLPYVSKVWDKIAGNLPKI